MVVWLIHINRQEGLHTFCSPHAVYCDQLISGAEAYAMLTCRHTKAVALHLCGLTEENRHFINVDQMHCLQVSFINNKRSDLADTVCGRLKIYVYVFGMQEFIIFNGI